MNRVVEIITMTFLLIGIYLFLSHGSTTVRIIDTLATNSVKGIKTLQGR